MTILLERPFPPPTIPDFRAPDPTGARPAGWRIEETSNATGVPLPGPRWRPDGGPDGEPCVEVAGQEATYTIAAAEPVPVQPGRRYVVTFWVSSAGHFARYYQRGPGVRWLAADGRPLAEPALPARILPGRRDDFAHEWRPVTVTAAAPDEAAFAVPAYRVGQTAADVVIRIARPDFHAAAETRPWQVVIDFVPPEGHVAGELLAGHDEPVLVRVKVTDAAGDIVADGTLVELESRDGSLEPARARTARGHVVAYFTQRPGLAPGVARVTAHAYEGGDLTPAFGHPSPTGEGLNTTSLPNRVPPLLWERGPGGEIPLATGTGELTLLPSVAVAGTISDAATGRRLAARVTLRGADGAVVRGGFWADGAFRAVVPPGPWTLVVSHGFDYEPFEAQGDGARDAGLTCALRRFRDLRAVGWAGMEPHKHIVHGEQIVPDATFVRAALGARADGLDAFFGANRWGDLEAAAPAERDARCAALTRPDLLVAWNHEIKNYPTGHSWEIGGGDYEPLLEEIGVPGRSNRAQWEHHLAVRRRGGVTAFTHPNVGHNPATELPFCLYAGPTFDALDIIMSKRFDEWGERNEWTWYWLLDHGYRIAATSSTDGSMDQAWASPIGAGRTYVYLGHAGGAPVSVQPLAQAIRAGRTVASNGPFVVATAGGKGPGDRLVADGRTYHIRVEAWGAAGAEGGLQRVELVRNGARIACWAFPADAAPGDTEKHVVRETDVPGDGDGWLVARAVAHDGTVAIASPLYLRRPGWRAPRPIRATVTLDVQVLPPPPVGSQGGADEGRTTKDESVSVLRPSSFVGTMAAPPAVVEAFSAGRALWSRAASRGRLRCRVPVTTWFRVSAPAYQTATTSIFYDFAPLHAACCYVGRTPEQRGRAIASPEPFQRVRRLLDDVRLRVELEPK